MKRSFLISAFVFCIFSVIADSVHFVPEKIMRHSEKNIILRSNQFMICRSDKKSLVFLKIDTRVLQQIPVCKIKKITLQFTVFKSDGTGGILEFRPLEKEIGSYQAGVKTTQDELANWNTKPAFAVKLPQNLVKDTPIELDLSLNDQVLELFQKGAVISCNSDSSGKKAEVYFYGISRINGHLKYTPRLIVEYSTPAEKLKFSQKIKIEPGKYVAGKHGDLYYNGEKLFLFGSNIGASCSTKEDVDSWIDRLLAMNVNAMRVWLFREKCFVSNQIVSEDLELSPSKKGDGSYWDVTDYMFYRFQQEGIFVHATFLQAQPKMRPEDVELGALAPYLKDFCKRFRINMIRKLLNRVNFYTGQRYAEMPVFATYEIHNENGFVSKVMSGIFRKWKPEHQKLITEKWNAWLLKKYGDRSGVLRAWKQLDESEDPVNGTVVSAPIYGEEKKYPEQRGCDFLEFVEELFISTNRELEAVARSCAPEGVGVNSVPFVHATHIFVNLHAQYADSAGEMTACGIYQTPYTFDKKKPFYPYQPFVTQRPHFYNINFQASSDKPYMIYESSFHRPYRWRVEFLPVLGLLGASNGWDAIYHYNFQNPKCNVQNICPLYFSGAPLPTPTSTKFGGYTRAFLSSSDEVVMASLALTAQACRNGIASNTKKTRVIFGKPAIRNPLWRNYSTTLRSSKQIFTEQTGGGTMEYFMLPGMYRRMVQAPVYSKLSVDFDPEQKAAIRMEGDPLVDDRTNDLDIQQPSPDLVWDPKKSCVRLDNSHSKIHVGLIPRELVFKNGVSFKADKPMFGLFGLSTRDGKSVADSGEMIFALTSESHNTGFKLNFEKMVKGPLALIPAVENPGTFPVIVIRPSGKVSIPGKPFLLKRFNFTGYCYRKEMVSGGSFDIKDGEPLFLAVITR